MSQLNNEKMYEKIYNLVALLPEKKLSLAQEFLTDLCKEDDDEVISTSDIMNLPLSERRKIMARQAQNMFSYYDQSNEERHVWQAGEFSDEYYSR